VSKFHLYWVRTDEQFDDAFAVARTARAAACHVREEAMAGDAKWAEAKRIATLPDHLQDPSVAVGSTEEDPRIAHWASEAVLEACGVKVVHAKSPRVFFWNNRLFTEGVFDYLREQPGPQDWETRLAVILGRAIG
jgi:hypothetical protein